MKIASLIHPKHKPARNVSIHGTPYVFAKQADGQFVADVDNVEHAEVLLASRHFVAEGSAPTLTRAATPASPKAPAPVAVDEAVAAEAAQLLKGSVSEISKNVGRVSALAVVRAAVELEKAGEKPRASAIALLESTLESARQAGVAG